MKEIKYTLPRLEDKPDEITTRNPDSVVVDSMWVRVAMNADLEDYEGDGNDEKTNFLFHQFNSPVFSETMTTSIGGHFTINPDYSWGPTSDMHYKGRLIGAAVFDPSKQVVDIGVGRYYAEAINSNSKVRTLIIEAGVPEFKSALSFLMTSVDVVKAKIASEGRTPYFYTAGKWTGNTIAFRAFPLFTAFWMLVMYQTKKSLGLDDPKFYHFRSDMPNYIGRVNTILNTFSADLGVLQSLNIIAKTLGANSSSGGKKMGHVVKIDSKDTAMLAKMMPHIFKNNGVTKLSGLIDVSAIFGRYQRIIDTNLKLVNTAYTEENKEEALVSKITPPGDPSSIEDFMKDIQDTPAFKKDENPLEKIRAKVPETSAVNIDGKDYYIADKSDGLKKKIPIEEDESWAETVLTYSLSAAKQGLAHVAFQVEYIGASTDTFSNTFKDIPIKALTNQHSKRMRDVRFSLSDGNAFGSAQKAVTDAMRDFASGVLDGASMGITNILSALNGDGLIEFPQMWDDSATTMATHSFKIKLNTPYANPLSSLFDIYLPYSAVLGLVLPKDIGRGSYASPPLIRAFMQGVVNIDLGMVKTVSATRGGGNNGFNANHAPTDIEIVLEVMDLSPYVSAPTPDGFSGMIELSMDDYAGFNRYSKVLTGQGYEYSKFISKRALLKNSKQIANLNSMLSPEYWGRIIGDTVLFRAYALTTDPDMSVVAQFGLSGGGTR